MPLPPRSAIALTPMLFAAAVAGVAACSSTDTTTGSGGGSSTSTGVTAATGAGGSSTSSGAGGAASCAQAATMLDVAKGPGAGDGYAKATLTASCTDTAFVVESNGMPTYTFVQTTPNALKAQSNHWEIPLHPAAAAATTAVPLLGLAGFAVNGMPFFGPNEAGVPADEAYGDPVYNGLMDPCFGHTANEYHYHSLSVKCLIASGLVAKPWMNADPKATEASPIIAWAMDGYPVYGSQECADGACAKVVVMQSGYEKTGDPKTYAWKAYTWKEHVGDATYLDACNGHTGPKGDYHYHATSGFPYVLGCYHGTPSTTGGMMGSGSSGSGASSGSGMMGPKACTLASECVGACPPGSVGCTCGSTPMGMACIPTCTKDADCPAGMMGQTLTCKQGVCAP
ncbi:MAG: YHYH protein [Byssovorax sp.]